jgi:hypothetical protein
MKDEVTLYKTKLAFMTAGLPPSLIDEKFEVRDSFISDLLRGYLSGYLWGEPGPTRTIKYPVDWWSAFKVRWFPAWLLNRYPALYQCHQISLNTLYPLFRVSLPKETPVLKFTVSDYKQRSQNDEAD